MSSAQREESLYYFVRRFYYIIKQICFFCSSRRRHTRLVSDWSSEVCSSDLANDREWVNRQCTMQPLATFQQPLKLTGAIHQVRNVTFILATGWEGSPFPPFYERAKAQGRSEERRVGEACRSRGSSTRVGRQR